MSLNRMSLPVGRWEREALQSFNSIPLSSLPDLWEQVVPDVVLPVLASVSHGDVVRGVEGFNDLLLLCI